MRLSLLFFFNTIIGFTLIGQASLHDLKLNVYQNLNSSVNQNYIRLMNESAVGNETNEHFEFDNWTEMNVTSTSGDVFELDSANYHIADETIFFNMDGHLYFLYPGQVESVVVDSRKFVPLTIKDDSKKSQKYFEVLVEGDMNLYKNYTIDKKVINNHPMGISHGVQEYEYLRKVKYYYSFAEDNTVQELPKNKKNFISIFKRNRNKMVEFARENNFSTKSELDVIRMFEFNNHLIN